MILRKKQETHHVIICFNNNISNLKNSFSTIFIFYFFQKSIDFLSNKRSLENFKKNEMSISEVQVIEHR
jgi:hypothetical protein